MSASITSGTYGQRSSTSFGETVRRALTKAYEGMISIQERRATAIFVSVLGKEGFEAARAACSDTTH